jgi:hypothetical protein
MTRRWIVPIAVHGLMPMLMAMRPADEVLLKAAYKGDLFQVRALLTRNLRKNLRFTFHGA